MCFSNVFQQAKTLCTKRYATKQYGCFNLVWNQVVAGSNPVTPTNNKVLKMSYLNLIFNAFVVFINANYL